LEQRLRQEADWRVQFRRRPWLFVAIAFGVAFVLGVALGHQGTQRSPDWSRQALR